MSLKIILPVKNELVPATAAAIDLLGDKRMHICHFIIQHKIYIVNLCFNEGEITPKRNSNK